MDKRTLLLADDNEQFRRLLYLLLQGDGRFDVLGEAADGVEALRMVERFAPELLLLDLSMPNMDGLEVLEELSGHEHPPTTVVLTGYADDALRARLLAAGAYLCLEKGADFGGLVDELAAVPTRRAPYDTE